MPTIITGNTVWRRGTTVNLTDDVQIAAGATLTIQSGVTVNGNGHEIMAFGKLVVAGTSGSNANLNDVELQFGNDNSLPGRIEVDHARITGGGFLPVSGRESYGSFTLTNSFLTQAEASYIWYPKSASVVSGNVFYNTGGLGIGTQVNVSVTDNVFINTSGGVNGTASVVSWANYGATVEVSRNTFFNNGNAALEVVSDGRMTAPNNYFGTSDAQSIQALIIDRNDDLNRPSVIAYAPAAAAPSATALQALAASGLPIVVGTSAGEMLTGAAGATTIYGGDGDDHIDDPGGSDTLIGGAGADTFFISRGGNGTTEAVRIDGGSGNDTVTYQNYREGSFSADLGAGDDRVTLWTAQGGGTALTLGSGRDTIALASQFGGLEAGASAIRVADFTVGSSGDRLALTEYLNTALRGWDGSANPFGSAGFMQLAEGDGATLLQIDRDGVAGGQPFVTIMEFSKTTSSAFIAANLDGFHPYGGVTASAFSGTAGRDTLTGGTGADSIAGLDGDDAIDGRAGKDKIDGGGGNDQIEGGSGDDVVEGGEGDDRITDMGGSDTLRGGAGADDFFISRGDNATVETVTIDAGADADVVSYQNYRSGSAAIDLGTGDDRITIWTVQDGGARLSLGAGRDTITLSSLLDIHLGGALVVADFAAGVGGDQLDMSDYLGRALSGWNGSDDPFGQAGYLRLVQFGADTVLQVDKDGAAGGARRFENLVTFADATAGRFRAENLDGFTPKTVAAAQAASAFVTAPTSVTEGVNASASISVTLRNVTTASGTVTMSFDAGSTATNGADVSVPAYSGSYSVSQSPGGDYRIDLPSIAILTDQLVEGTETISVRIRASGQVFASGSDTQVVTISLKDAAITGTAGADTLTGAASDDTLIGLAGDDVLDGRAGADSMTGGTGNDTYYFDNAGDRAVERAGEGVDAVFSSVNIDFGTVQLENLTLTGSADLYGYGNALANTLTGNAGINALQGRAGDDRLAGGGGDDRIDGGAGYDTALFGGFFRQGSVSVASGAATVKGQDGTDTLVAVERFEFADGQFILDADGNGARVQRLYDAVLSRGPDQIGLEYWLDQMNDRGQTLSQVGFAFLNSPEFQQAGANVAGNGAFVDFLYQRTLGRAADAGGRAFWVDKLDGGLSRGDALINFSESPEHRQRAAGITDKGYFETDDAYQTVALLYDTFANRTADMGGLSYWAEQFKTGARGLFEIADQFAGSVEFQGRTANLSNGQLVDYMYQNTLGRAPDAAGRSYWTARLDAGLTDGGLLYEFAFTPEHEQLLLGSIVGGIDVL